MVKRTKTDKRLNNSLMGRLPPRLMIAAPQGRCGKTTVTLALARVLRNRGLTVQPFKKGPDYIDPSWLRLASENDCFNLDPFLMTEDVLLSSFAQRSRGADIAIVEGAMGLFDSPAADGKGSVAWLARLMRTPIILVVNTERMTRSVAALVSGFQHFEPGTNLAGVILNRVSGSRHVNKLKEAVESHCNIPVLGAVPRNPALSIAERHLGLIPSSEKEQAESVVAAVCDKVAPFLDVKAIIALAEQAPEHSIPELPGAPAVKAICRIGIVTDRAFSFYYPENIEALRNAGADIVPIDAFSERALPKIDGLYIGGGFPEFYAAELEENKELRRDIGRQIESGLPTYAECGGLMYLARAIRWQGKRYEMVGKLPAEVEISNRPQGHGYMELEVAADNNWFVQGTKLHGHEFHHSRFIAAEERSEHDALLKAKWCYKVLRGQGIDGRVDGFLYKNLLASYAHLHALATPHWAPAFVALANNYRSQVKAKVEVEERERSKKRKRIAAC